MLKISPQVKKGLPFSGFGNPYLIALLVLVAITGLWISFSYISNDNEKPAFHEIGLNSKEVIQALVTNARTKTSLLADSLKQKQSKALSRKFEWINKTDITDTAKAKNKAYIDSLQARTGYLADSLEEAQLKTLDKIQQ